MTLSELLEELKAADPETADDIRDIVNVISIKSNGSFALDAYYPDFIIQGCIQRACEGRGWHWYAATGSCAGQYIAIADQSVGVAVSATEALLAAYIAAVKKEKRSTALAEE